MKSIFSLLLLIALFFSCEKSEDVFISTSDDIQSYIIGYTGGWGGSAAYKLEDGQLYRSVADRNLGSPDDIVNTVEFRLLEDEDKLQAVTAVMADYPATAFEGVTPKFDCAEAAWDGTCPYLIVITEKGDHKAWTRSEFDDPAPFIDYLNDVSDLLNVLYQ